MKLKFKIIFSIFLFILGSVLNLFVSASFHNMLSNGQTNLKIYEFSECVESIISNEQHRTLFLLIQAIILLLCSLLVFIVNKPYQADKVKITDKITIPAPAGQGQYGMARFMTEREKQLAFKELGIGTSDPLIKELLRYGEEIYRDAEAYDKIEIQDIPITPSEDGEEKETEPILDNQSRDTDINTESSVESRENKNPMPTAKDKNVYFTNEKEAGIVIGVKEGLAETKLFNLHDDWHSLIIGSTGCGKSRCLVIQSICTLALAGESIVVSDPKGELYFYTSRFLKKLGYDVKVLDFQNPSKSHCFNPLQNIIDAINDNMIDLAQTRAWDLVCFLVEKSDHSEPIWTNGEMAVLAAAILCVVYDNKENPQFQNMSNVYWFIAEMCKDVKIGNITYKPIVRYVATLPDEHPAKPLLGIADVAPSRTAGSFYTSALTTIRLFISREIYNITKKSDFGLDEAGKRKQAIFFIVPDEKKTFYPIVTLIVSLQYERLVNFAKKRGNRLPVRVNFILDEFGNFTAISDFDAKLTVARGYGMRFSLFIQAFKQLDEKYGEKIASIILSNCSAWIYLKANDNDTLGEIEKRLGDYTTTSYSLGANLQKYSKPSSNQNLNLHGRKLLFANEIGMLERPYQLVLTSGNPAIMYSPDLSSWIFNKMLGLGDRNHNIKYIMQFQENRPITTNTNEPLELWGIWSFYQNKPGRGINNRQGDY